MAILTFLLRAAPFLALRRVADTAIVRYLGDAMPAGIMVILVVYSVSGVSFTRYPYGIPSLVAIAVTVAVHLRWRNPLVSIVAGTACYVGMLHLMS